MIFGRDFRVIRALRSGGMGAVYVVDQLSTGKQRALKVMAPELATDQATRERFVLEARAASKIESDHVVEIVTAGIDEQTGAPFLVMELLRGEELADVAERTGPMAIGDVAEVLAQVGHALEQAHAHGIVHRDLKPENIFLAASKRRDATFTAKVLDFGIAKLVADSQKTGTQPLGTPLFMSPEQTDRKGKICPGTDVWALGLITFRLLAGQHFWREATGEGSLAMLLREIVVDEIPFASVRAAELGVQERLPAGFDAWFSRCVNRDIDERFADAGAAVRAFAELVPEGAQRGTISIQVPPSAVEGTQPVTSTGQTSSRSAQPERIRVIPTGGGAPGGVNDATQAMAAAPVTSPSALAGSTGAVAQSQPVAASPRKSSTGLLLGGALLAMAVGGTFVLMKIGGITPPPIPSIPTHSAPRAAAPVAPVVSSAAAAGGCPDGMALIPGGITVLGARDLVDAAMAKPTHEVTLLSFCLDKTEVTTKAYEACADKNGCERPLDHVSWPNLTDASKKKYSPFCNEGHAERAEHPVNCVAWSMADIYCKKRGARLPTEAEWEYAARGAKQRRYPWGDEAPDAKRLNACGKECSTWAKSIGDTRPMMYEDDDGFPGTAPVGSFPAGASAHGVLDLAGNVWEWTADWFAPYGAAPESSPTGPAKGTERVARGGDFLSSDPDWARPAWRFKTDPETYNHAIGFRCAAELAK